MSRNYKGMKEDKQRGERCQEIWGNIAWEEEIGDTENEEIKEEKDRKKD